MNLRGFVYKAYKIVTKAIQAGGLNRTPVVKHILRCLDTNLVRAAIQPSTDKVVIVHGHKMHIGSPGQVFGFPDLLLGSYERATTDLFQKLVRNGRR